MEITSIKRDLLAEFTKQELMDLANELGLNVAKGHRSPTIIESILGDIDSNGVPDSDECSDLMFEFLVAAEIINDAGEILPLVEEKPDAAKVGEKGGGVSSLEKPDCFGFVDLRDPACGRCKVVDACTDERTSNRPECFGLLYDKRSEECQDCIEAGSCSVNDKSQTKKKEKKGR